MIPLAGCILIPVTNQGTVLYGREFNQSQLDFIEINVTTKEEVIKQLGKPDWNYDQIIAYHWSKYYEFFVIDIVYGPEGFTKLFKNHSLIIKFDECNHFLCYNITEIPHHKLFSEFIKDWSCD